MGCSPTMTIHFTNDDENYMDKVKSLAKGVLRQRSAELWALTLSSLLMLGNAQKRFCHFARLIATFCSYLFWPRWK